MSMPQAIYCDYALPEPEKPETKWFWSEMIGAGEIFGITKEGRYVSPLGIREEVREDIKTRSEYRLSDYYLEDLNFDGDLRFYCELKSGEFFLYLAHFSDGQLNSIERPNLIEFEFPLTNPEPPERKLFCEDISPNEGRIFRITKAGRLTEPKTSGIFLVTRVGEVIDPHDLNFEGDLKFYSDLRWGIINNYVARFGSGQLKSIERIKENQKGFEVLPKPG